MVRAWGRGGTHTAVLRLSACVTVTEERVSKDLLEIVVWVEEHGVASDRPESILELAQRDGHLQMLRGIVRACVSWFLVCMRMEVFAIATLVGINAQQVCAASHLGRGSCLSICTEDVEPVCVAPRHDDNVRAGRVEGDRVDLVLGQARRAKESGVLQHAQGRCPLHVWLELARPDRAAEFESRPDQRCRACDLRGPGGRWVVLEHEKGVRVDADGGPLQQVCPLPKLLQVAVCPALLLALQQCLVEPAKPTGQAPRCSIGGRFIHRGPSLATKLLQAAFVCANSCSERRGSQALRKSWADSSRDGMGSRGRLP